MLLSIGNATSTTIFSSKTDKAVGFEGALICPASQKSISLSDTFCSAMKEICDAAAGANIIGSVSTEGYTFDDSDAVVDGKFIGLALDDVNEDDQTESRIDAWLDSIKGSL